MPCSDFKVAQVNRPRNHCYYDNRLLRANRNKNRAWSTLNYAHPPRSRTYIRLPLCSTLRLYEGLFNHLRGPRQPFTKGASFYLSRIAPCLSSSLSQDFQSTTTLIRKQCLVCFVFDNMRVMIIHINL